MASRGSVIPRFIELLKQDKPLTLTDPGMTRFLMSLEDSFRLVCMPLRRMGRFVCQKAPASTVGDLAYALNELFERQQELRLLEHGMAKSCLNRFFREKKWSDLRIWGTIIVCPQTIVT